MSIEVKTDDEFLDMFLTMVANHAYPKLVPTINKHGEPLDSFKISWDASIAQEQGFYPLISSPAHGVNYFVFFCKETLTTGYLSFYPANV